MSPSDNEIIRPTLLPEEEEHLIKAYQESSVPLDRLPYTDTFESLFERVRDALHLEDDRPSRREVLHRLYNLRKGGMLPRLGTQPAAEPTEVLF